MRKIEASLVHDDVGGLEGREDAVVEGIGLVEAECAAVVCGVAALERALVERGGRDDVAGHRGVVPVAGQVESPAVWTAEDQRADGGKDGKSTRSDSVKGEGDGRC